MSNDTLHSKIVSVEHTCSAGHITKVRMLKTGKEFKYDNFCNNLCTHNLCDRVAQITDQRIVNEKFTIPSFLQFVIWLFISPFIVIINMLEEAKWRE